MHSHDQLLLTASATYGYVEDLIIQASECYPPWVRVWRSAAPPLPPPGISRWPKLTDWRAKAAVAGVSLAVGAAAAGHGAYVDMDRPGGHGGRERTRQVVRIGNTVMQLARWGVRIHR